MRKVKVKTGAGYEVRYYLTESEALKYQRLGFNVKVGPRGGHYITEEDFVAGKKRLRERRNVKEIKDDSEDEELDELLEKLKELYRSGQYEEAFNVVNVIRFKFSDILDDEEMDYLDKIEDKIVKKGSSDVLRIELCKKVDSSKKYIYERVNDSLKVLSKFRKIDSVKYLGENKYEIKLGNDVFEVKYSDNGNVDEIWYYDEDGKKYKNREAIVKWLSKSKGRELENIYKAFSDVYGVKKEGNREIIKIERRNSIIDKIEKVKSVGRGNGRIRWLLFVMIKSKQMGLAVKTFDDVIKLLNSEGLLKLIMEMFSAFG